LYTYSKCAPMIASISLSREFVTAGFSKVPPLSIQCRSAQIS
jgi:hypothetical protein